MGQIKLDVWLIQKLLRRPGLLYLCSWCGNKETGSQRDCAVSFHISCQFGGAYNMMGHSPEQPAVTRPHFEQGFGLGALHSFSSAPSVLSFCELSPNAWLSDRSLEFIHSMNCNVSANSLLICKHISLVTSSLTQSLFLVLCCCHLLYWFGFLEHYTALNSQDMPAKVQ